MAGTIKSFIGGIGLVLIFALALSIFMLNFITTNNPTSNVLNNTDFNASITSLQSSATSLKSVGDTSKSLLTSYQPSPIYLFLIIYSAFAIPLGFLSAMVSGLNAIVTLLVTFIFGQGDSPFSIVIGVINGLLLIGVVLAILDAIRLGRTQS